MIARTPADPAHGSPKALPNGNGRAVIRVIWLTLFLNLINFCLKLGVGVVSRNLTVISDAIQQLLDGANNVIGLLALKIAWRPPDANHPYGHRKFEALASLCIGGFMALTCWELVKQIVGRAMHPPADLAEAPRMLEIGLIFLGMMINLGTSLYERARGRALRSSFLLADAAHTSSDVVLTGFSLASLWLAPGRPWVDVTLSSVVVAFILWTGWKIVRDNILTLTDAVQLDPEPIRRVVESVEGVANCHAIRSHGMPDEVHLDLHIVVPPEMTAARAEAVEMDVREALMRAYPEVAEVAIHHQTEPPTTAQPLMRQNVEATRRGEPPPIRPLSPP